MDRKGNGEKRAREVKMKGQKVRETKERKQEREIKAKRGTE